MQTLQLIKGKWQLVQDKFKAAKENVNMPRPPKNVALKLVALGSIGLILLTNDIHFDFKITSTNKIELPSIDWPEWSRGEQGPTASLSIVPEQNVDTKKGILEVAKVESMNSIEAYVSTFAPIAISEMQQYGIPASITLAQGILESKAGESQLAKVNNNHFGIKCFSKTCEKGHCSNFADDSHKDFFRKYNSAWDSYRAHSLFLQGKRYVHLQDLEVTDYKGWAKGLRKAGYATDKEYGDKLVRLIEDLELWEYDEQV